MKRSAMLSFVLGTLAACNGGTSGEDASATEAAQGRMAAAGATNTANGVRATIESLRSGSRGGSGDVPFTPPPSSARDPGPRDGTAGAGGHYDNLSAAQVKAFRVGLEDFSETEDAGDGLGPTFNADSCGGCHAHPAVGGSSPKLNPQAAFANSANALPSFIAANGPVREARFVRNADGSPDGGVHGLFTISGRDDAAGCTLTQPDFAGELARNNVIFRIPTPLFGAGLIESIPDNEILENQGKSASTKQSLGIRGRANVLLTGNSISGQANHNGNDGTVARFGWKAQNKSLLLFSGEAYNVEMGITNELFQTERDETRWLPVRDRRRTTTADLEATDPVEALSAIEKFTLFMRFLAPPKPSTTVAGASGLLDRQRPSALQRHRVRAVPHAVAEDLHQSVRAGDGATSANLYSDLLLHDMGTGLADGIQQGQASGREFRSAPLWGLGQRLFFLHDGRTSDLRQAILEHYSTGSEANAVTKRFFALPGEQQQDLLNFLRSL